MQRIYRAGNKELPLTRTYVMGILNLTPDSFYAGSRVSGADELLRTALRMVKEGADILDLGGESTGPGHTPVSAQEEMERVIPLLNRLAQECDAVLSVDTRKWQVAQEAVAAGAQILNDVGGFQDERMVNVAAQSGAGVIAMHPGAAEYPEGVTNCVRLFLSRLFRV